MQKIICGEIGGLKKENFISIYISIRYKSLVSPRRITENKKASASQRLFLFDSNFNLH